VDAPDDEDLKCAIEGNTLLVFTRSLRINDVFDGASFDAGCQALVQSNGSRAVMDLSRVEQMDSTTIGIVAATFFQCKSRGRELRLRVSPGVRRLLTIAGFTGFIQMETTEQE